MGAAVKPTRRADRRAQTVREIKELAMEQVSAGGPDSVSLSGIVREMSMSPAAVYRYFANRDALLADLVVDAYNDLADYLTTLEQRDGSAQDRLDAVLRGTRAWALTQPNAYRLIFHTTIGSGQDLAADRTVPAASRSMTVIIHALAAATGRHDMAAPQTLVSCSPEMASTIRQWAQRTELTDFSVEVLTLALLTWTRLHGIISLELGGHLAATGIGAPALFETEVNLLCSEAAKLPAASPNN